MGNDGKMDIDAIVDEYFKTLATFEENTQKAATTMKTEDIFGYLTKGVSEGVFEIRMVEKDRRALVSAINSAISSTNTFMDYLTAHKNESPQLQHLDKLVASGEILEAASMDLKGAAKDGFLDMCKKTLRVDSLLRERFYIAEVDALEEKLPFLHGQKFFYTKEMRGEINGSELHFIVSIALNRVMEERNASTLVNDILLSKNEENTPNLFQDKEYLSQDDDLDIGTSLKI